MPDLNFEIAGAKVSQRGLVPLLLFDVRVSNTPPDEDIRAVLLNTQIQIQSLQRAYSMEEKEKLVELFGAPERWGQTLRNQLWAHVPANVSAFSGGTNISLPVPCSFDLNVSTAKYFYALDEGEVPLLFLFSGAVFYAAADGRLQTQRISWEREASYRMPIALWRGMMEAHYPNCAWLYLRRDLFDRLYEFRRRNGIISWDETVNSLLAGAEAEGVTP